MKKHLAGMNWAVRIGAALLFFALAAAAGRAQTSPAAQTSDPILPYTPSLDLGSMDRSVDPCVDLYHYACGTWQKNNPIPPDQTSWSVYAKLYEDNLKFLRTLLDQAAVDSSSRNSVTRQVGDFYAACMDEAAIQQAGRTPVQPYLDTIAALKDRNQLPVLVAKLQKIFGRAIFFAASSTQNPDNSEQVIAELDQGGLGLPDRDYYTKEDAKSKETREKYLQYVQRIFELSGDDAPTAKGNAETVMRIETQLAKASLTRTERRDPNKLKHLTTREQLHGLVPAFDWKAYYSEGDYPAFDTLNVDTPDFFKELNGILATRPMADLRAYLRFHVVSAAAPTLSQQFVDENFSFYRAYLRGAKEQTPRWKRCVSYVDHNLDDALGQAYVAKLFSPQLKASTLDMVKRIEAAMEVRIKNLDWMSPATKDQALTKLHGIRNKIGYPDKWRSYDSLEIKRNDFAGNMQRSARFESQRQINKIGKPVDRGEWLIPATTVDAYYDSQMNDINFPAGVLQAPLYDPKMDDAPNYGNTGGTVGHELTHAFDDEGSQFDAYGNLKNWWGKEDREKFEERTKCVREQYDSYAIVDDVHLNGALTLGENVGDLGGEILAYMAWQDKTKEMNLQAVDGLTPEQRFFIGYAQWDCANDRPEDLRLRANIDPHSNAVNRINGVVVNMPEYAKAFSCRQGQPMTKPAEKVCKVW
jgi:endothelin-converting enzyme/putative endopeptidase